MDPRSNLGLSAITLDPEDDEDGEPSDPVTIAVNEFANGAGLHVTIDGVDGVITGTGWKLYADRISGGKSEALGSSNGFFINVLGRVINTDDPYFGLKNLNHSAWAKFRATIRADGLDPHLSVNREGVLDSLHFTSLGSSSLRCLTRRGARTTQVSAHRRRMSVKY